MRKFTLGNFSNSKKKINGKKFFSKIYNVFEVKQKKTFLLLSFLMLLATILETFGIGLIIPIVNDNF